MMSDMYDYSIPHGNDDDDPRSRQNRNRNRNRSSSSSSSSNNNNNGVVNPFSRKPKKITTMPSYNPISTKSPNSSQHEDYEYGHYHPNDNHNDNHNNDIDTDRYYDGNGSDDEDDIANFDRLPSQSRYNYNYNYNDNDDVWVISKGQCKLVFGISLLMIFLGVAFVGVGHIPVTTTTTTTTTTINSNDVPTQENVNLHLDNTDLETEMEMTVDVKPQTTPPQESSTATTTSSTATTSTATSSTASTTSSPPIKPVMNIKPAFHHTSYTPIEDPFQLSGSSSHSYYASLFTPPSIHTNIMKDDNNNDSEDIPPPLGYYSQPSIFNNTLVFVSEGDLYLTQLSNPDNDNNNNNNNNNDNNIPHTSMKLTNTVGNVLTPHMNPIYPHLIAFSATYTSHRELYVLDLRPKFRTPATQLTYSANGSGIRHVLGWSQDGTQILYSASNSEVGMPNTKVYQLSIRQKSQTTYNTNTNTNSNTDPNKNRHLSANNHLNNIHFNVGAIQALPLAQATDATPYIHNCLYFIRFKQSSQTFRYVGGTAETLWGYCQNQSYAVKLYGEYQGSTRLPKVYQDKYLLFVSDRYYGVETLDLNNDDNNDDDDSIDSIGNSDKLPTALPSTLNLFVIPLPTESKMYKGGPTKPFYSSQNYVPLQLTSISCEADNQGRQLMEYNVDPVTGNIVLRVGADFRMLYAKDVQDMLNGAFPNSSSSSGSSGSSGSSKNTQKNDNHNRWLEEEDADTNADTDTVLEKGGNGDGDAAPKKKNKNKNKNKKNASNTNTTDTSLVESTETKDDQANTNTNTKTAEKEAEPEITEPELEPEPEPELFLQPETNSEAEPEVTSQTTESKSKPKAATATTTAPLNTIPSQPLHLALYSDFNLQQERRFHVSIPMDIDSIDIFSTLYHQNYALLTTRGQGFAAPIIEKEVAQKQPFSGMGEMLPPRGYKILPSSHLGGMTRVLAMKHVPSNDITALPHALILATDPLSATSEHALYLLPVDASIQPYMNVNELPLPILGGHTTSGGSAKEGGLGSILPDTLEVSPCGRRAAWLDTDGRLTVMTIPKAMSMSMSMVETLILPQENRNGEPIVEIENLVWSPSGRYLAIEHASRNQFSIISIADLSDPEPAVNQTQVDVTDDDDNEKEEEEEEKKESAVKPKLILKQIVQATPSRFNCNNAYWGKSRQSYVTDEQDSTATTAGTDNNPPPANTLYFLTDRDVVSDVTSPWGTRAPQPHFKTDWVLYALPLHPVTIKKDEDEDMSDIELDYHRRTRAPFPGGGASELVPVRETLLTEVLEMELMELQLLEAALNATHDNDNSTNTTTTTSSSSSSSSATESQAEDEADTAASFDPMSLLYKQITPDMNIDFGLAKDDANYNNFARKAYRIASIPPGQYRSILCQLSDNPSLVLLEKSDTTLLKVKVFAIDTDPTTASIKLKQNGYYKPVDIDLSTIVLGGDLNTARTHFTLYLYLKQTVKIVPTTLSGILDLMSDTEIERDLVDTSNVILSIYPKLEYQQMFADAWRMLRDYFYDSNMHSLDWKDIFDRYQSLVSRCAKREELDDILMQMASELSALHVFVYGGEYGDPSHGDADFKTVHSVASLGATVVRDDTVNGYVIQDVHVADPDFASVNEEAIYSPLSDKVLRLSGQRGLNVGDVIVSINGEHVMSVPDMHMLLRGQAGHSVRLQIMRQDANTTESIITVPISSEKASDLRYSTWEYRTREKAKQLALQHNFTVGYIHLRDMDGISSIDAFVRGYFPDYDKDALIIDVRHNNGGNIDSWLLTALQREAFSYWGGRVTNVTNGGLGWDEQFAFRGHLVVLVDESTASDGEGFSRGVMELGLGKTVGMRTWGGGIWLSSDNHLVDGGIATAPEIGVYNFNYDWGLGIENMGVDPDIVVDNDPVQVALGNDLQLERAIEVLKEWLEKEPVVLPKVGAHPDKSLKYGTCASKK